MKEIWKDIPNYEGYYQASNLGRIKSLERIIIRRDKKSYLQKETILKQAKNKKKYYQVGLSKNFKHKTISVHRLVAQAFIPNPDNLPQVNHIDGHKENNCVDNLEWCDNLYNMQHSYKLGLRNNVLKSLIENNKTEVLQYDLEGNFIKKWNSMVDIENSLHICNQNVSKVCKGTRKKAGGFIWKYANPEKVKKYKKRN